MEKVIFALTLGIFLGWFKLCSYRVRAWLNKFSWGCLMVMLLCLGAKIGCDAELLQKLGLLGQQALFIGSSIILGSLAAVGLVIKVLGRNFYQEDEV